MERTHGRCGASIIYPEKAGEELLVRKLVLATYSDIISIIIDTLTNELVLQDIHCNIDELTAVAKTLLQNVVPKQSPSPERAEDENLAAKKYICEFIPPDFDGKIDFENKWPLLEKKYMAIVAVCLYFFLLEEENARIAEFLTHRLAKEHVHPLFINFYSEMTNTLLRFMRARIPDTFFYRRYTSCSSESECITLMAEYIQLYPDYETEFHSSQSGFSSKGRFIQIFGVDPSFINRLCQKKGWSKRTADLQHAAERQVGLFMTYEHFTNEEDAVEYLFQKIRIAGNGYRRPYNSDAHAFKKVFGVHPDTLNGKIKDWSTKPTLLELVESAEQKVGLDSTYMADLQRTVPKNYQTLIQIMANTICEKGNSYVRPSTRKVQTVFGFDRWDFMRAARSYQWEQPYLQQALIEAENVASTMRDITTQNS